MDLTADDLCLIDAGITSLHDVPVNSSLLSLNLHCNYIVHIDNLHSAHALCHLDLSSNRITSMRGLSSLSRLQTLNLSCNFIDHVIGLGGLVSLISLNISYNKIVNIDGFQELDSNAYQLKFLQLQGNQLSSVDHVIQYLKRCRSLRSLVLVSHGSDTNNPLCSEANYGEKMIQSLPHLINIDGLDVSIHCASSAGEHFDSEYVGDLYSDGKSSIDNAGNVNGSRQVSATFVNYQHNMISDALETDSSAVCFSTTVCHSNATGVTSGSEESQRIFSRHKMHMNGGDKRTLNSSSERKKLSKAKASCVETDTSDTLSNNKQINKGNACLDGLADTGEKADKNVTSTMHESGLKYDCYKKKTVKQYEHSSILEKKQRDDLKDMYIKIMKDLEIERDRRLKAEEISKCMSQQLQLALQDQATGENVQEVRKAVKHLKKTLTIEKDLHQRAKSEVDSLKAKVIELQNYLVNREQLVEELMHTVDTYKESIKVREKEHSDKEIELNQQVQESKLKAGALAHEMELIKLESSHAKQQIGYLENMLAECEKTHKNTHVSQQALKSQDVEDLISKAFAKAETSKIHDNCVPKEKYDAFIRKYAELENEFRAALQIESQRFKQLQVSFFKC